MVYFGGFFAKLGHFAGFSSIIEAAMCGEHNIYIWVPRSPFIRDGEIEEGGCVDRLTIVYCIPNIIKMNVHSATSICSIEL